MILIKITVATSTIYVLGLLWLGTLIGWDKPIIALGAKPFLLAEIFKVVLLALVTKPSKNYLYYLFLKPNILQLKNLLNMP